MEKRKRKHVTITLAEKLKVLERVDNGESHTKIAREIGVGSTTIYDWIKNRNHLESLVICGDLSALKSRRTLKRPKCERLEAALWSWFVQERRKGSEISGPMIKEKAIILHEQLGYGQDGFLASDGWLQNWKKRHDVANVDKWIHTADDDAESTDTAFPQTTNPFKFKEDKFNQITDTIRTELCEVIYNKPNRPTNDTINSEREDPGIPITPDIAIKEEFDYSTETNNIIESEHNVHYSIQTENNFIETEEQGSHIFHSESSQDSFTKSTNPRSSLTLDEKLNVLQRIDDGESVMRVAREMRIGQTTIYDWIRNRKKIENLMKCVNLTEQKTRKTLTKPKFEMLEKALWLWFVQERRKGTEISGTVLKEKALILQKKIYGDQDKDQFLASNGWLQNWKKRHNVTNCEGWIQIHTAEYAAELTDDQIVASVSQATENDEYQEPDQTTDNIRTELCEAVYDQLNQTSPDTINSKDCEESTLNTIDVIQSDDELDELNRNSNVSKNIEHEYDEHIQITPDIIAIDQHYEPTRTNSDIHKSKDEYGDSKQDIMKTSEKEHIQITPDVIISDEHDDPTRTAENIIKNNLVTDDVMRTEGCQYDESRSPVSYSEAILALDTLLQYMQESSQSTPMDFDFVDRWRYIAATKQD